MFRLIFKTVEFIVDFMKVLTLSIIATCLLFTNEFVKMVYDVNLKWKFEKEFPLNQKHEVLFEVINDINRKYEGLDDILKGVDNEREGLGQDKD